MSKNQVHFMNKGSIEVIEGKGMHIFPYHTHESFMVGMILAGRADFNIGKSIRQLENGMVYRVPTHTGISITPIEPIHYITICIKGEARKLFNGTGGEFYYRDIANTIRVLINELMTDYISEAHFFNQLIEILGIRNEPKIESVANSYFVEETAEYIRAHLDEKINLNDLAQKIKVSKYHLVRVFTKKMGIGPIQYAQMCKLRYIRKHIIDYSEAELSYKLNFSSQSHMCTIFKKYMGITPKCYKTLLKEQ